MNKVKEFRVRETSDKCVGIWTVANGPSSTDTTEYINKDGIVDRICRIFHRESKAQAALDLYLKKQEQVEQIPNKQFGHPRFYEILEQMKELHSRKNHDYAGTSDPLKNLRACERLKLKPFMGVMVRLQDKWSRLEEFVKSGTLMVKNESVIDTLMDNAVYSVLAIILYEEQQKEEDYDTAIDYETGQDRIKLVVGGY